MSKTHWEVSNADTEDNISTPCQLTPPLSSPSFVSAILKHIFILRADNYQSTKVHIELKLKFWSFVCQLLKHFLINYLWGTYTAQAGAVRGKSKEPPSTQSFVLDPQKTHL